jgi:ATP-dependent 26S proteasome regulatory subunit
MLPLSCAQLFSMYIGEGEAMLRDVFQRARLAAPSIIFLDEIDALAGVDEIGRCRRCDILWSERRGDRGGEQW